MTSNTSLENTRGGQSAKPKPPQPRRPAQSLDVMRYLVVIVAVALTACSDTQNLSPTEAWNIVLACDALAERFPVADGESRHPQRDDWPPALSLLNPEAVRVDSLGVYVRLESRYVEEEGLYVPASSVTKEPPGREGDPSYEQIGPRLYRYKIKG